MGKHWPPLLQSMCLSPVTLLKVCLPLLEVFKILKSLFPAPCKCAMTVPRQKRSYQFHLQNHGAPRRHSSTCATGRLRVHVESNNRCGHLAMTAMMCSHRFPTAVWCHFHLWPHVHLAGRHVLSSVGWLSTILVSPRSSMQKRFDGLASCMPAGLGFVSRARASLQCWVLFILWCLGHARN